MPDYQLIFRTTPVQYHFHRLGTNWIERSLELITDNGAAVLNLQDYGIAEGLPARCIVLQGQSPYEVLLGQKPVKASVRDGRVLVDRPVVEPLVGLNLG